MERSSLRLLPLDLLLRVLHLLPPNELACTACLLCKEVAQRLSDPGRQRCVRLSQPLPAHAERLWRRWQEGVRQLPFRGKLRLLSIAAATGCTTNCVVAWRLVEPSLFTELLPTFYADAYNDWCGHTDPGAAAVRAGHVALLPWLVAWRWPVHVAETLQAVAQHCDLATLQRTWRLMVVGSYRPKLFNILEGAVASLTPDAPAKMEWLLQQGYEVGWGVAHAAVVSDEDLALQRLRWCLQHLHGSTRTMVLEAALSRGSLEAVRQLQAEGGFDTATLGMVVYATGSGVQPVEKLRWLKEGGHGMAWSADVEARYGGDDGIWDEALAVAVVGGNSEAVPFLVEQLGATLHSRTAHGWGLRCGPYISHKQPDHLAILRYFEGLAAQGLDVPVPVEPVLDAAWRAGDAAALLWMYAPERSFAARLSPYRLILSAASWPKLAHGCAAAEAECLRVLRLLTAGGAHTAFPQHAVAKTARLGALALVRWLVEERGCPVGKGALDGAVDGGNEALLDYLVECGAAAEQLRLSSSVHRGDLATLRLLVGMGAPWGEWPADRLVRGIPLPVVVWLVQAGMPLRRGDVGRLVQKARGVEGYDTGAAAWLRQMQEVLEVDEGGEGA